MLPSLLVPTAPAPPPPPPALAGEPVPPAPPLFTCGGETGGVLPLNTLAPLGFSPLCPAPEPPEPAVKLGAATLSAVPAPPPADVILE